MSKEPKKYCYLSPAFPKNGVAVLLLLEEQEQRVGIVPSSVVYTSLTDTARSISEIALSLKSSRSVSVADVSLLINISFEKKIPLYKYYWRVPEVNYSIEEKIKSYTKLPYHPHFYKIVVTPTLVDEYGKWYFDPAFPILNTAADSVIETFMSTTNHVVEHKARFAALYSVEDLFSFNWKQKKVSHLASKSFLVSDVLN